jgi:hypothetical protein
MDVYLFIMPFFGKWYTKRFMQTAFRLLSTILLSSCQLCGGQTELPSSVLKLQYTGVVQEYVVPSGVTSIFVKMWGAGGGGGAWMYTTNKGYTPSNAGAGGYSYGIVTVTPGSYLYIVVGQGGWPAWSGGSSQFGGWPNGGPLQLHATNAGGGGGRSQISMFSSAQTDKAAAIRIRNNIIMIAAGGGGGGINAAGAINGTAGGGLVGNSCRVISGQTTCVGGSSSLGETYFLKGEATGSYTGGGGDGYYGGRNGNSWGGGGGGSSYLDSRYVSGNTFAGQDGYVSYNVQDSQNNFMFGRGGVRTESMWQNCGTPCQGQHGVVYICAVGQCENYECPENMKRRGVFCVERGDECLPGTRRNSDACQNCTAGTFSTGEDETVCSICGAGTYSDVSKASSCTLCNEGTFLTSTQGSTSSACVKCSAGKYSTASGAVSEGTCSNCSTGTFSNLKASTCTSCSAGNYMSQTGANLCSQCGAGVIKKGINDEWL